MGKFRKGQKVIIYPTTGLERIGKISSVRAVGKTKEYTIRENGKAHHFYGFELRKLPEKPKRRT